MIRKLILCITLLFASTAHAAVNVAITSNVLRITGDSAPDTITLAENTLNGQPLPEGDYTSILIDAGAGADKVSIKNLDVQKPITIGTGDGADTVAVESVNCSDFKLNTGLGQDAVNLKKCHFATADVQTLKAYLEGQRQTPETSPEGVYYTDVEVDGLFKNTTSFGLFRITNCKSGSITTLVSASGMSGRLVTPINQGGSYSIPPNAFADPIKVEVNGFNADEFFLVTGRANDTVTLTDVKINGRFICVMGIGQDVLDSSGGLKAASTQLMGIENIVDASGGGAGAPQALKSQDDTESTKEEKVPEAPE